MKKMLFLFVVSVIMSSCSNNEPLVTVSDPLESSIDEAILRSGRGPVEIYYGLKYMDVEKARPAFYMHVIGFASMTLDETLFLKSATIGYDCNGNTGYDCNDFFDIEFTTDGQFYEYASGLYPDFPVLVMLAKGFAFPASRNTRSFLKAEAEFYPAYAKAMRSFTVFDVTFGISNADDELECTFSAPIVDNPYNGGRNPYVVHTNKNEYHLYLENTVLEKN